jgi:hypothetical protein
MRKNASRIDANVRRLFGILVAGFGLFVWAAYSSIGGGSLMALGLYLILTGTFRFCPEYLPFHVRTQHEPMGPVER